MSKNEIKFTIGATGVDKATSDVKKFQQTTTREMTQAEKSVASSIGKMIAQYASLTVAINKVKKAITTGIDFNQFKESQETAFTVMMKSADKAKAKIEELQKFSITNPLTFKETIGSSKQLLAYGFDADELVPTIERLGTVALATGNKLDDVAYVFGTLRAQGRAYSRDLMQFGTRGIPIYEELAKVMNVNVSQIQKMASEGKIGFREVEKAFESMTGVGGRFSGMLEQYMSTLTGKLSMLSDIAEQSAGRMMRGATDSFKKFVDEMTVLLESDRMQTFFTDLNIDIKTLADIMFELVKAFIKLLPLLTKALKVFIAYKAVTGILGVLKGLPELLLKAGGALMALSSTGGMVGFLANLGAAGGLFAEGFLMAAPTILAVLAPILLALKMIKDLKEDAYMKTSDEAFNEVFSIRGPETIKVIQADINFMRNQGLPDVEAEARLNAEIVDYVTRTANQYGKSTEELAKMLYFSNQISATVAKMLGFDIAGHFAKAQAEIARMNTRPAPLSAMERETQFFSEITGRNAKEFIDPNDAHAFGRKAANVYLEGFQKTWKEEKLKWQNLFTDEKQQELLKSELEALTKQYNEAFERIGSAGMEKSGFGPRLRERMLQIMKQLEDGFGKGLKNKIPELTKWWLPDESRVKATVDAFDDIELIYEKALYNANAEIDARKAVAQENYNIAETVEDQFYWAKQVYDIEVQRSEIMKNITKEAERQRDASKFNVLLSGNSEYFKDKQAKAFKAYEGTTVSGGVPVSEKIAGIYDAYKDDSPMQMLVHGIRDFYNNITSFDIKGSFKEMWDSGLKEGVTEQAKSHLEGTEVGSIMSTKGLGVVTQMVAAFMEMLMSIENVNKVLNPFATIFESMKNIIEPFVNSALKPIVNILEMIGEMLGKVLAPIISGIQIVMSALYVALLPLNIIISVVGEAFAWFNDHVIYPLGNSIIDTMNAVIKALNKIPFVSIKYIDRINKVSDALDNLAGVAHGVAQNMQSSLSSTINYLTKKLNALVDKQVESARSLYEVGAITGAEYEAQIAEINRGRLETDLLMISKADQQIEDAQGMLSRLYELALLDATIAENQLTDEQVKTLLKDAGLVKESQETMFAKAVRTALDGYGGATAKGIEAGINKIIASIPNVKIPDAKIPDAKIPDAKIPEISNTSSGGGSDINKSLNNAALGATGGAAAGAMIGGPAGAVIGSALGGLIGFFSSRDVGSGNIPYDHLALVHKGEGIVPATFMEAIRSGELTLSGRGAGSGVTVVVNVEGSVQAENNLADTIAEAIYTRRSRGLVTV